MTSRAITLALAITIAASTSALVNAQRGQGGRSGGSGTMRPVQPSASRSLNSPSFPVTGLNGPAFPLRGPVAVGPTPRSPFDARPGTYTRVHRNSLPLGVPFGYGYVPFDYEYGAPFFADESTYEKLYRTPQPEITAGVLFLDVTPVTALVFVDTAYVGSVSDVQARGVTLSAGRHYLDLEAPGYDKKTIDITIAAGEPLRYRYDMTAVQRAAAAAVPLPPRPPQTMYAIAGCYAGNRPPVAANLPQGCDIAKVRVIRPQPRTN
jgi:hypothetical protein